MSGPDETFARLTAAARQDLDVLDRLWPAIRRLRRGQSPGEHVYGSSVADGGLPEVRAESVESDDLRALLEALRALDDLRRVRREVEHRVAQLHRARQHLERRAPVLAQLLADRTQPGCTVPGCSGTEVRNGLCRPCESSWQTWRTRHDSNDLARWRIERARRLKDAA